MRKAILNLQFIFKPSYWVMNYPFSKIVDDFVNYLLDNHEFEENDMHTAKIGGVELWVGNAPYACMTLWGCSGFSELENYRPSRLTIQKGLKKYKDYKDAKITQLFNELKQKQVK